MSFTVNFSCFSEIKETGNAHSLTFSSQYYGKYISNLTLFLSWLYVWSIINK